MIDWHRLFGITMTDVFAGSPFEVLLELDLSLKQQFIDVVILRRRRGEPRRELPDGLQGLKEHNLLTYKSLHEPLDDWAIAELIGHYVNYRKQVSPQSGLLPPDHFALYAVATRFPEKLASQVELVPKRPGVHEVTWGTQRIPVLVLSEMPESAGNAIWNLFSGVPQKVTTGAGNARDFLSNASTILNRLFEHYRLEHIAMPYTMEDFRRDAAREILEELPPEERLRGLPPEELLRHLSPEERLRGVPAEERLRGVPAEERLRGLTDEELAQVRALLDRRLQNGPNDKE